MVERLHVSTDLTVADKVLVEEVMLVLSDAGCCLFSLLRDVCEFGQWINLWLQDSFYNLEISS